ncbi:MAG: nucleotidyltransferase domain-containing protein [Bdellovibrionales bacterium]|nr:nucleotidyltransferase domain-containing protein [Bdellovibrionales bacterium]
MSFGLSAEDWSLIVDLAINPLKAKKAQVWIFGSRARGDHTKFSDLDVLFVPDKAQPITLAELSTIKENLEESHLPIKVDIVANQDLATDYRENVERDRVRV